MNYCHINVESALNKINSSHLPYKWDLNIYRGCEHACVYCYARYSNSYLGSDEYFGDVFIKDNVIDMLEKKIRSKSWKGELINFGSVTDSYQPIEKEEQIMPEILKMLIRYKTPCNVTTKSHLLLRDYNLYEQLATVSYVNIAVSITTCDEEIRQILEPASSSVKDRFEIVRAFSNSKVKTGIHIMPIIPYITDSSDCLENVFIGGIDSEVDYIRSYILNLSGSTKYAFFAFLHNNFDHLYKKYIELYRNKYISKEYEETITNKLRTLYTKYSMAQESPIIKDIEYKKNEFVQLSIFDEWCERK